MLAAARTAQPDLWDRTERIARIIDPAAFSEIAVQPAERQHDVDVRLDYMRSIAMSKAQEVLRALGVNTDTDWDTILSLMTKRRSQQGGRRVVVEDETCH